MRGRKKKRHSWLHFKAGWRKCVSNKINANKISKDNDLDSAREGGRWEWGHLPEIETSELGQGGDLDRAGWGRSGWAATGDKASVSRKSIHFGTSGRRQEESSSCPGGGQNLKCLQCHCGEFEILLCRQEKLIETVMQNSDRVHVTI